jgi:hypothetical protein
MPILNRRTLAAACFSLSLTLLTNEVAQAQKQNLVLEDKFDVAFLITSPTGTVASHEASSLIFGETTTSVNSNFSLFSNLTLSTQLQQVVSNSYDLNFFLTTGSNSGFIPPGITLREQAVNQWIFDLSNFFAGINNGIDFSAPVTYNSAQGSWFDDGNLVFQTSYLPQLNIDSTSTQLVGQFDVGLPRGDLAAFGNGIDAFTLKINVTSMPQLNQAIPESSTITALLIYASLGLTLARRHKSKKSLY